MAIEIRKDENTAIERFKELRDVMAAFPAEQYIRLIASTLQEPSSLFRPVPAAIKVNPQDERDVYPMPGSRVRKLEDVAPDGKVCLHTTALERIGGLLGIRWLGTTFDRDKTEPYLITAHVRAEWTDAVGERISLAASATCDYREGSIGAAQLGGGLPTARQFISERSEARARNRIVRKVTGMPSAFTKQELQQKAFVAVRWILDERQPDVRKALIERGTRAAGEVFGAAPVRELNAGNESAAEEFVADGAAIDTTAQVEAEPEIPEAPAPRPALDVQAIRAGLEVLRSKARGDNGKASQQQLLDIGEQLRDVLDLRNRLDVPEGERSKRYKDVRLAVLAALFGVTSSTDLSAHQATAVLTWLSTDEGQQEARALFDEIAANAGIPLQQTLASAAVTVSR